MSSTTDPSGASAEAGAPSGSPVELLRRGRRGKLSREDRLDLMGHLDELRKRLLISAITVLVAAIGAFMVHRQLISALTSPLGHAKPVTLGVAEPFMTSIKVSFMAAMAVSLPVLLWQLWSFVAPATATGVRRTVLGFVSAGSVLFAAGVAFAYLIALPSAIGFLIGFDSDLYNVQVRAQDYLTFAAAVLLSVGLVFQLPIVLLALVRFRVLSYGILKKYRRYSYVALAALAVALPGVDPVTTTMWLVPLFLLYEGTVLVAWRYERRLEREGKATSTMLGRFIERREEKAEAEETTAEFVEETTVFTEAPPIDEDEIAEFKRKLGLD
jgi:sec-independent protein translocase protein TatC